LGREKIKGTLALLLNSPLGSWSIYVGKLGGVLGFTAILLLMTLPAAAACHAVGGTAMQNGILALYAVLSVAALQLSTLALLVSSRANAVDSALRVTYALVLTVAVLPLVPHALMRGKSDAAAEIAAWVRCLSPIPAVMEVLGQSDVGAHGVVGAGGAVPRYVLLAVIFSAICAFATVRRLNHRLLDRARSAGVIADDP